MRLIIRSWPLFTLYSLYKGVRLWIELIPACFYGDRPIGFWCALGVSRIIWFDDIWEYWVKQKLWARKGGSD